MISVSCPTFNRFKMTTECFDQILHDNRVDEVVIVDDASTDNSFELLSNHFKHDSKVRVYLNEANLDCYANKKKAIELASNKWVCLWDSDNVFGVDYLNTIFDYSWDENTAYMPSFAMPMFSYEAYSGLLIDRHNVAEYFDLPLFETMLNCMNYFVPRNFYLDVFDSSVNPHTADSLYQNYNWLLNGGKIFVVPNLRYYHRIHSQGHYVMNNHKTGAFHEELKQKFRQLK